MVRRVVGIACAVAAAGACGWIADLPDYRLREPGDDATSENGDAAEGAAGDSSADATREASDDATDAGDEALDAGPDAKAPKLPASDPASVACGAGKCAVATEVCCNDVDADTCTLRVSPDCNGVIAACDEAKNCSPSEVCCVGGVRSYGLETSCQSSCSGAQSCRTNGECGGGHTCVAWWCAGYVVATCDGVGSSPGCQ